MDKLICIGKNYLAHSRELGDSIPEMPVLFLKPPSCSVQVKSWNDNISILLPRNKGSIHYECEILVQLDQNKGIKAVSLGLDLTLRDLQGDLKKQGHPWEKSKVFRNSAIIGPWIPVELFPDYLDAEFTFELDGEIRQKGRGGEMRLTPDKCISYAAQFFPLCLDDICFTGTPNGVGPLHPGQTARINWANRYSYQLQFS